MAWRTFWWQLAIWLGWVVVAPAALWLRRRWPLERSVLKRALAVHLVAVIVLCAAHSGIVVLMRLLIMPAGQPIDQQQVTAMLTFWSVRDLPFAALFYGLIIGIASAVDYYRRFRERQLRASQLEAQLAQAELQTLKDAITSALSLQHVERDHRSGAR
jgi:hypothetical protein